MKFVFDQDFPFNRKEHDFINWLQQQLCGFECYNGCYQKEIPFDGETLLLTAVEDTIYVEMLPF